MSENHPPSWGRQGLFWFYKLQMCWGHHHSHTLTPPDQWLPRALKWEKGILNVACAARSSGLCVLSSLTSHSFLRLHSSGTPWSLGRLSSLPKAFPPQSLIPISHFRLHFTGYFSLKTPFRLRTRSYSPTLNSILLHLSAWLSGALCSC